MGDCVTGIPDKASWREGAMGDCVTGIPDMDQVGERGQWVTV